MNTTAKSSKSTESEATDTSDDVDEITAEITRLRSDMSSLVETIGKVGRRRGKSLAETASGKADEGLAAGEAMLAEVSTELERLEQDLVAATRRNPYRALGIAACFGFLLAMILRR